MYSLGHAKGGKMAWHQLFMHVWTIKWGIFSSLCPWLYYCSFHWYHQR